MDNLDRDFNTFLDSLLETEELSEESKEFIAFLQDKEQLQESSKFLEDSKSKSKLKEQYGSRWKEIVYANTWKKYNAEEIKEALQESKYRYQQDGIAKFNVYKGDKVVNSFPSAYLCQKFCNRKNEENMLIMTYESKEPEKSKNINTSESDQLEAGTESLVKKYKKDTPGQ